MIVKEEKSNVISSGIGDTEEFGIKASSKAFRVLSKSIYKRPIEAIIRELSTNAVDAHIESRSNRPFKVTLPTGLNPVFTIRDYGTGLSEEGIRTVYTKYFESTKEDSNDYNGTLGLGSKSPFAYTSMLTITSYFEKVKTIYIANLGINGTPTISIAGREETDEPNGLEINISVKREDVNRFTQSAKEVYTFFEVTNQPDCNVKLAPVIVPFKKFKKAYLYSPDYYSPVRGAHVVQSNVRYPIDVDSLEYHVGKIDPAIKDMLYRDIIFQVNNGDVNFAPSREELEYTPTTIASILEVAKFTLEEWKTNIRTELASCKTTYERTVKFNEIKGNKQLYLKGIEEGFDLHDGKITVPPSSIVYNYGNTKRPRFRAATSKYQHVKDDKGILKKVERDEPIVYKCDNVFESRITPTFYVYKGRDGSITSFEEWRKYEEHGYNANDFFIRGNEDDIKIILDSLGNPPYTEINDKLVKKVKVLSSCYQFKIDTLSYGSMTTRAGTKILEDIDDLSGFYLIVNDLSTFNISSGQIPSWTINTLSNLGLASGLSFYAFRKKDLEKVKENSNLKPLTDEVIRRFNTFKKVDTTYVDVVERLYWSEQRKLNFCIAHAEKLTDPLFSYIKSLVPNSSGATREQVSRMAEWEQAMKLLAEKGLVAYNPVNRDNSKLVSEIETKLSNISIKYPLYSSDSDVIAMIEYMNALHSYRVNKK